MHIWLRVVLLSVSSQLNTVPNTCIWHIDVGDEQYIFISTEDYMWTVY